MLGGARSSELGVEPTQWALPPGDVARFYASEPPLLSLMARRHAVSTHAFVDDDVMVGHAPAGAPAGTPVGVDLGFERVTAHRRGTGDTHAATTRDASAWLRGNADTRFFLFVSYSLSGELRTPGEALGSADGTTRRYVAEAAKADQAVGALMQTLAEAGLRERTIVVLTAAHGETLSSAHAGISALDRAPIRYNHAAGNFEETTRVPILIVAPGLLSFPAVTPAPAVPPEGGEVKERVRTTDLAPTVADLLGLEAHPRFSGRSLAPLARGEKESDERVVVTEGRGSRAIMHGRHRLVVREGLARETILAGRTVTSNEELYDLADDPGERRDLAPSRPDVVAEMRARLAAALANAPVAGSAAATATATTPGKPTAIHLRFVGGAQARRVSGTIVMGDAKTRARSFTIDPVELGKDALKVTADRVEIALTTSAATAVGFDIVVDPPGAPVRWDLYLEDQRWPSDAVFGGPYGLLAPVLRAGITTDEARHAAQSALLPPIDPRREVGVFVVRSRRAGSAEPRDDASRPQPTRRP